MTSDWINWYKSIPEMTRYWFTGCIILPLLRCLGIFSPSTMLLDWNLFFFKFQIWRPITALFYYPITLQTGFHWLLMLYFLYDNSKSLESRKFEGSPKGLSPSPADYLFMLLFNWLLCTIIAFGFGIYFLLEPMVLSVLYIRCQLACEDNPDTIVQFWFGSRFKAVYLPWILATFNMVLRSGGINEFIGILVGHVFYYLVCKYPRVNQEAIIPSSLCNWFPNRKNMRNPVHQSRKINAGLGEEFDTIGQTGLNQKIGENDDNATETRKKEK